MTSSSSGHCIDISDVTIKSPSVIASVKLSIKTTFRRNFDLAKDTVKETTLVLAPERPSLSESSSTPLTVTVYTKGVFNGSRKFKIKSQDLLSNVATVDTADPNKREYRTTVDGTELTIGFTLVLQPQTPSKVHVAGENRGLRPVTDDIFDICPRFRILIIGDADAGMSSLIWKIFGVRYWYDLGKQDINRERYSVSENKRFVFHQSGGVDLEDENNAETVMKFLNDRKAKEDIKDQVHAVWLFFRISIFGGRLFETGAEKFFQLLSTGELGKMPIIAIFTKYDTLVDHYLNEGSESDDTVLDRVIEARVRARARLAELCIMPFREQIGGKTNIPCVPVSVDKYNYNWTLYDLSRLTTELVRKHLTEDVALLSVVAQRVTPSTKLEAVIAVVRKWYWKILTKKSPANQREMVWQNLHKDIIRIWNLRDPDELLDSDEFKRMVGVIESDQNALSIKDGDTSLSMLVPLNIVLHRLMTYVVSLMLILQLVLATMTATVGFVFRRLIDVPLRAFIDSPQRLHILSSIKQHFRSPGAFLDRDAALQKITELFESNRISIEGMAGRVKDMMGDFINIEDDEPW